MPGKCKNCGCGIEHEGPIAQVCMGMLTPMFDEANKHFRPWWRNAEEEHRSQVRLKRGLITGGDEYFE